jgi:NAD-dependent dihydropyrimidine dehydrogenase PreA subunit/flavodoxin
MNQTVHAMYFSPTGTTKKITTEIAAVLSKQISDGTFRSIDFTLPAGRSHPPSFSSNDIVIFGTPVYAGRVPNVLLKYLNTLSGNGAPAIAVVLYGNRHYDAAAVELQDILEAVGFRVVAAGAFIGEHSFSKTLARGRPDNSDLSAAASLAQQAGRKIAAGNFTPPAVSGPRPYTPYYVPKNAEGIPVDIRKVTPKTGDGCIRCMLCARVCPMGSIDFNDPSRMTGICIKCGACIKLCPQSAKYYDDENYLWHKRELEEKLTTRREPELFF